MANNDVLELLARIKFDSSELERGLKQASERAKTFSDNVSKNFGTKIGNALSSFGDGLKKVGHTVTELGKAASIVTAGVGAVLTATFSKAKSFIGTYESAMTVFKRKLEGGEEAAKEMYTALVDIAKGSSYAQEHMVSAGQTLVAMGVSADDTKKYIQAATDAISGFGGSGADVENMSTLFAKISQQTNLYTRDIQSMVLQGIPAWDILATKYHTTTDEVKNMVSSGLVPAKEGLNTITEALEETNEQSEMFKYSVAGMAKELKGGTLTGSLDSLNTSFRTFSLSLLDLDPRTESGQENIRKLNAAIAKFGETLENVGKKFSFVGDWIGKGLENVTQFLDNFNKALDNMPQGQAEFIVKTIAVIAASGPALLVVGTILSKMGIALKALGGVITWISSACIAPLITAFGGLLPAIAAVSAIVIACVAVFKVLKQNWDNIVTMFTGWLEKTGLLKTFESIKEKCSQLGEKLSKLGDLFTVLGTAIMVILSPAIVVLMGMFNGLVKVFDGIITIVGGVIDILAGLGEIIVGIFTFDTDKIMDGFNTLFSGIGEIFTGFFDGILGYMSGFYESVWATITSFFDTFLPQVSEWFNNIWNVISEWFVNLPTNIMTWLSSIGTTLSSWFSSLWTTISNWFVSTWASITTWFNDLPQKLGYALGLVIGTLIKWGAEAWNWVTKEVPKIIESIVNFFKELPSKIWTWLVNAYQKVVEWGSNTIKKGKEVASNFLTSVINFFKELPGKIWTWLSNVIQRVISWGSDMVAKGRQAASNLATSIVTAIQGLPSQMLTIGSNIVQGIWNGISGAIGWVKEKVGSFARGILDGMKAALGIHSPSTLFEKEVGVNIALGVESGWENTLGGVINRMKKGLNAGVNAFASDISGDMSLNSHSVYNINPYRSEESKENSILSLLMDLKYLLYDYLPMLSNRQLVLNTGAVVGELSPEIDGQLGAITRLRERGN